MMGAMALNFTESEVRKETKASTSTRTASSGCTALEPSSGPSTRAGGRALSESAGVPEFFDSGTRASSQRHTHISGGATVSLA